MTVEMTKFKCSTCSSSSNKCLVDKVQEKVNSSFPPISPLTAATTYTFATAITIKSRFSLPVEALSALLEINGLSLDQLRSFNFH